MNVVANRVLDGRLRLAALFVAVSALLGGSGCEGVSAGSPYADACRALGICDEPPKPPGFIDVLCDSSVGSSCDRRALERTVDAVLHHAVERPGSHVRLWVLGKNLAETVPVGEQTMPAFVRGSARGRHAQAERFVETAREFLLTAASSALEASPVRRSPLAEGMSKIGLADADQLPRTLVVLTDGREVSALGDFECGAMPSDARFLGKLRARSLLGPTLLSGAHVEFAFLQSAAIPSRGCAVEVDREVRVRALWTAALKAAGATRVHITSGPPTLNEEPESDTQQKESLR